MAKCRKKLYGNTLENFHGGQVVDPSTPSGHLENCLLNVFISVMWIRTRIRMNPQVSETLDPDPESAYFEDPDSESSVFKKKYIL